MEEKEMKIKAMRQIFDHAILCEWSLVDVHRLFNYMSNCLWYRRTLRKVKSPESASLAQWSRNMADDELSRFLKARCLPGEVKYSVWFLVNNTK